MFIRGMPSSHVRIVFVLACIVAFSLVYGLACDRDDFVGEGWTRYLAAQERRRKPGDRAAAHAVTMLYFSLSNAITMGFGDIVAGSLKTKLLVMAQMLTTLVIVLA